MSSALDKVRELVYRRRLRIAQPFVEYDPLRKHVVLDAQFKRCLGTMGLPLSASELDQLSAQFMDTRDPQMVNYFDFCQQVDEIFSDEGLIKKLEDDTMLRRINPDPKLQERLRSLLYKISLLCRGRGVTLKYSFKDFDHLNTGNVTESQFIRGFPFDDFSEQEMKLLIAKYGSNFTGTSTVNYRALNTDVSDLEIPAVDHVASGDIGARLYIKKPQIRWQSDDVSALERLQVKLFERRVAIRDIFFDFDPLRRGTCHVEKVKVLPTLLRITVPASDIDEIIHQYSNGIDFNYSHFCRDIESAILPGHLEESPLDPVTVPHRQRFASLRRNPQKLTREDEGKLAVLENRLRSKTVSNSIYVSSALAAFDKTHLVGITRNQFSRVMSSLGFEISDLELDLLCKKYCNLGNAVDFNYLEFCTVIEPTSA